MNFRIKVLTAVLAVLIFLPITAITPQYGQTTVKKWADDRKSAFTFTFDDGLMSDYYNVMPILDSFGYKGTFFVIADSMTDDLPGISRFGTWNQFRAMALGGHEIASHSVTHQDFLDLVTGNISTPGTLLYELYQSKYKIEQKITNQKCITLGYPYFDYNTNAINRASQYYESARTSNGNAIAPSLTGTQYYKIGGYEVHFTTPRNSTQDDLDELADFELYQQYAISDGYWGMLVAHEVVPFTEIPDLVARGDWYPMSSEWLTSLCQWIKQRTDDKEVWVETMGNVVRYMKEREKFSYSITSQTTTQIRINVTDNLTNTIYNYPLTVDINVPPAWEAAIVTQGSSTDTIITFTAGVNNIIRAYVIPDGGILILDKTDPPLPVEITTFTATVINKGVHLTWKTATEINNHQFDVERRMGNSSWQNMGSLPGAGNSNSPRAYAFIDKTPLSKGKYSYRLKQIDNDGNYKYSGIVEVEVTFTPSSYSLEQNYPNPFNPSTRIKYSIPQESYVRIIIFNALGEEVRELTNEMQSTGTYELNFNSSGIPSGVYFYSIIANSTDGKQSFRETKKMILMR